MGPAFSIAESLPGVVPVFSGVPYLIVRGATPSGSLSYYDSLELPALFHVALGPSVIEPRLLGSPHLYRGASTPARMGPHIGAAQGYDGPDPESLRLPMRRVALSMLDTSGFLNVPLQEGALSIGWQIGNPGLILGALNLEATLSYYDYHVRYDSAIGARTRVLLLLLGAGDQLGDRTAPQDDITLSFQRALARVTHRHQNLEYRAQLMLGTDSSGLGQELQGTALRAAPSMYAQWRWRQVRWRVGSEFSAALPNLRRGAPTNTAQNMPSRDNRITLDPEDFLDGQPYKSVPGRGMGAVYSELELEPAERFRLELGVRASVWMAGSSADLAVSPMLASRYRLAHWLELHAAAALTHKPRTSPLPLPGLNDVALDGGVEAAAQTELGALLQLDEDTDLDVVGFYHRYLDVVYFELIFDCQGNTNASAAQALLTRQDPQSSICRRSGLPTADGESHGLEFLLKRSLTSALSGFASYTLAFANATARDGTDFSPQADVRHVLNLVLSYRFAPGFTLGARLHYRTGKPTVNTVFDLSNDRFMHLWSRLPGFLRIDVRASYRWRMAFGYMTASIGMQNVTFSRESTNRDCVPIDNAVRCTVDYQPFIVLPNLGLQAEF